MYYRKGQHRVCGRIWCSLRNKSALVILALMIGLTIKSHLDGYNMTHLEAESLTIVKKSPLDITLERQEHRKNILQKACASLNYNITENMPQKVCAQTIVDYEHKFLYCLIHKASSTFTKKTLVKSIAQNITDERRMLVNSREWLGKFGLNEKCLKTDRKVNSNISEYFKFLIVRHPLKRLLSAYRDKFLTTHPDNIKTFQKGIGTKIVRKYRNNPSHKSLTYGNDVTFEEFLRHVIDTKDTPDTHWNTFWDSCHPCENSLNFIAHLETLNEDMEYILKTVSKHPVPMPKKSGGSTDKVFKESYGKIPQSIMDSILEQFHKDFLVFGYDPQIYKE